MRLKTQRRLAAFVTDAWRRKALPTALSVVIHLLLIATIGAFAVGVSGPDASTERPRLAEIDLAPIDGPRSPSPPNRSPVQRAPAEPSTPTSPISPDNAAAIAREAATPAPAPPPSDLAAPGAALAPPPSEIRSLAPADLPPPTETLTALSFGGLAPEKAAASIVYVVDGSGAMIASLSLVLDHLSESLQRLSPTQRFQIVVFGADSERDYRKPPLESDDDDGWLRPITPVKRRVAQWLDGLTAQGRSNPLDGLRAALALDPELVYLLSQSIPRTGADPMWGVGADATLDELDRLNPIDPKTGFRPAVIKSIQFINPDPTRLMEKIGLAHGDGAGSFRLLTLEDLGRVNAEPPKPTERDLESLAAAESVRDRFADPAITAAWLHAAFGLPTPDERSRIARVANAALDDLANAPPSRPTGDDAIRLARATAWAARGASTDRDDIHRDAGLAVRAELASVRFLAPEAEAERRRLLTIAARLLAEPDEAANVASSLLTELPDLELSAIEQARALLAASRAALASDSPPTNWTNWIDQRLHQPPFIRPGSSAPDPFWKLLEAEARVASAIDRAQPPQAALAPLLDLEDARADRFAAAVAVRLTEAVDRLLAQGQPPEAIPVHARYRHALVVGSRPDRASESIQRLQAMATERPDAAWEAAIRLLDAGRAPEAADWFWSFATAAPDHPRAPEAVAQAAHHTPANARAERLAAALERFPAHDRADAWRLELAAILRGDEGIERLHAIDPASALHRQADALELTLLDEVDPTPDRLARAADLASRLEGAAVAERRLRLAEAVAADEPARSVDITADLLLSRALSPSQLDRAELVNATARINLADDRGAFLVLSRLADRLEASGRYDQSFWRAQTLRLELMIQQGDDRSRLDARRHAVRLGVIDPALGGEPWASRIADVLEAAAPAVDSPP